MKGHSETLAAKNQGAKKGEPESGGRMTVTGQKYDDENVEGGP